MDNLTSAKIESITRKRDGNCEASIFTGSGFQRVAINLEQYQTILNRLSRFILRSGPSYVGFDICAQR